MFSFLSRRTAVSTLTSIVQSTHLPLDHITYYCYIMRSLLVICCAVVMCLDGYAQYRFRNITIEDGLTENSITDIFQDSDGYMWVGTQDGISRYDGYRFKNFNISSVDSISLSDNFLWGFAEDSLGYIWCCSRDGVNRIDKTTGACRAFYPNDESRIPGSNQAASLAISGGLVYVVFINQIYTLPVQQNYHAGASFKPFDLEDGNVVYNVFTAKSQQSIYAITRNGIYDLTANRRCTIPNFTSSELSTFFPVTAGVGDTIWFSTGRDLYSLVTLQMKVDRAEIDLNDARIYGIGIQGAQKWLSTDQGVWITEGNQVVRQITKNGTYKHGLPSNFISALAVDKLGNIWLGTSGNGICLYVPDHDQFKFLGEETFGTTEMIRSIVQRGNTLYLCTEGQLLTFRLEVAQITSSLFLQDIITPLDPVQFGSEDNVSPTSIALGPDSAVLIGTRSGSILVLDQSNRIIHQVKPVQPGKRNLQISGFCVRRNGEIWVASYNGLFVLSHDYKLLRMYNLGDYGLEASYFLSVFEDKNQNIWLGANNGIFRYSDEDNQFVHYKYDKNDLKHSPGFNFVTGFVDLEDGNLWMSTFGGGLSKLNLTSLEFEHFTTQDGLANNVLNGIQADGNGRLWMSTNKGISRFDVTTLKFVNYNKSDGIYFSEFMMNAHYQNALGDLYFGTPTGVVAFNPLGLDKSDHEVELALTGLDVNYVDKSHRLKSSRLELYPNDESITIHFAGLHYSESDRIRYRYKMDAGDTSWVETEDVKATFTSLPDGRHFFYLNATNAIGNWNTTPLIYEIVVHPPYYKTWWFIAIIVILVLFVLILIIRHFAQLKMKRRLRELTIKQEVNKEKQRISRDLHDTIGAQITYLISSIDYESTAFNEQETAFEKLGDKARNIMTELRNVLWVLDKEEVYFVDFSRKVSDYVNKVLEPTGTICSFEITNTEDVKLSPALVSNLFRIIQEALNNVIKHANAKHVAIKFGIKAGFIEISIRDNGIGFDESSGKPGHFGIKNMIGRTKQIGGECQIVSTASGVRVELEIPIN